MMDFLRKYERILTHLLLPVILLLYAFVGVRQGADITDTMYALSNYENFGTLDPMWALSTYLANVTGAFLTHFPFGSTMAGMNFWCTFLVAAPALIVYYLLLDRLPVWALFAGGWIALSLCWCPRVILYNYLTYLFLTLGAVLLLKGLSLPEGRSRALFLLFAGVCLGLNVLVRFPNLTHAALIVVAIMEGIFAKKRPLLIMQTVGLCVAGYAAGFLLPWLTIVVRFGGSAYGEMISSLFSMTSEAADYSAGGMLTLIFDAYAYTFARMVYMLPLILFGLLLFLIRRKRFLRIKIAVYCAATLLLLAYYFASGVFTRNYWYYDSVFNAAMMIVIAALVFFVIDLTGINEADAEEKLAALCGIVIILVTPLGSNNYTYPVINNLFLVLPLAITSFVRTFRFAFVRGDDAEAADTPYRLYHLPWGIALLSLLLVLTLQGTIFHAVYAFNDGADGTKREIKISSIPKLATLKTTRENANALTSLYPVVTDIDAPLLTFGKIPGLCYLTDKKPAIDTVWPDLDSYTAERFDEALANMNERPLIVVHDDTTGEALAERKYNLLQFYMEQNGFSEVWSGNGYTVYY